MPNLTLAAAATCYVCGAISLALAVVRTARRARDHPPRARLAAGDRRGRALPVHHRAAGLGRRRADDRVQHRQPALGHAERLHPDHARRADRRDLLHLGRHQHRDRGPAAARRVLRGDRDVGDRVAVAGAGLRRAGRVAGRHPARPVRDRLPGRPDRARRRAQHAGARPHRLPVQRAPDRDVQQHAEQPEHLQPAEDPAAGRHPDHRPGLVRRHRLPLHHLHRARSGCRSG